MNHNITTDEIIKCVGEVSDESDSDIFLLSGGLNRPADDEVIYCIEKHKTRPNVMLILTTFGGEADVAYRIARCVQRLYGDGKFEVVVSYICKSAGTLIALGASGLIMDDNAELGPLDVQLAKPDELGERISGLTPNNALAFLQKGTLELFEHYFLSLIEKSGYQITTKTAAEIATKLTVGMFAPVYSQLDPMRLGEYHRNMAVAGQYGKRLMRTGNLKSDKVLERLTHRYPSHSFVIDREEAKTMFKNVRQLTDEEKKMIEWVSRRIFSDLVHKDEQRRYVAVIRYLDPTIKTEDSDRKESQPDEKSTNNTVEAIRQSPDKSEPQGGGTSVSDAENNTTPNSGQTTTKSGRPDAKRGKVDKE